MKIKKISIILLFAIITNIFLVSVCFADSSPTLTITSDEESYSVGDNVELTFKVENIAESYNGWKFRLNAINGLKFESWSVSDTFKSWTLDNKCKDGSYYIFSAIDSTKTGINSNEVLCKVNFTVLDTASLGNCDISTKTGNYSFLTSVATGNGIYVTGSHNINIVSKSIEPAESSYSANITTDKTTYNVGDTVKLTAALTPAQAASLASGSMKISYDKDALDLLRADPANDIIRVSAENGTAVASFTTDADKALSVSKDTPVELATFSFTAKKAGTADFEVTEAIADEAVDGALKSAVVNKPESKTTVTIEAVKATCDSYGSDYKLVKYVSDSLPQEGKAYAIGGSVLSYVPAYSTGDNAGKYVFVGLVTETPADLTVSEVDGNYDTIQATGDANGDKATNITDAQTVIYMIASKITSASEGAYDWLNSDVNGDGVINALDAQAIQYFVHYGEFGQFN